LTWAADEHVLLAIAAGLWLTSREGSLRRRRQTDHLLLSVAATAILPHLLKRLFDQKRPDRQMIHGRRHGIPRSGKPYDAFPSGHAMHVGAIASAVSCVSPRLAPLAWGLGGLVAATRIVLLAHWTTDVLAGLTMGALVERCLRPLSKPGPRAATRFAAFHSNGSSGKWDRRNSVKRRRSDRRRPAEVRPKYIHALRNIDPTFLQCWVGVPSGFEFDEWDTRETRKKAAAKAAYWKSSRPD